MHCRIYLTPGVLAIMIVIDLFPGLLFLLFISSRTTIAFKLANGRRISRQRNPLGQLNCIDMGDPDAATRSDHPPTLKERPEKIDASSLLESEVCDYGILTALAEEHIALGNYDEAMKLAKNAIATADHTKELNNVYSAYAEGIWADALYNKGLFQESADHFRGALKSYERHYQSVSGPEAVELVGAVNLAAWNLLSKKDYEDATAAWSTALGMTERLLGPKNTDVAGCMTNLAISHMNMGDLGAAPEALLKKALAVYMEKKMEGSDIRRIQDYDEPIWKLKIYIGDLYFLRGNDNQALEYYSSVEDIYNMGDIDDIKVARALENFGIIEWRRGKKEHSEKLFSDAMFVCKKKMATPADAESVNRLRAMLLSLKGGKESPNVVMPSNYE